MELLNAIHVLRVSPHDLVTVFGPDNVQAVEVSSPNSLVRAHSEDYNAQRIYFTEGSS